MEGDWGGQGEAVPQWAGGTTSLISQLILKTHRDKALAPQEGSWAPSASTSNSSKEANWGGSSPLAPQPPPPTYRSIRHRTLPEGWDFLQFLEDGAHPGSHLPTQQPPPALARGTAPGDHAAKLCLASLLLWGRYGSYGDHLSLKMQPCDWGSGICYQAQSPLSQRPGLKQRSGSTRHGWPKQVTFFVENKLLSDQLSLSKLHKRYI